MIDYTIIPTSEEYIEDFWTVLDSVAKERQFIAFLEGPPMDRFRQFVLGNIKSDMPQFLALVEGTVVGWCDICKIDRPIKAHTGTLGIGILKEYRGHGVGKNLIQIALQKAWSIGLTRVELTVREPNTRALELYKRVGFQVEGMQRNAIRMDGIYENLIAMAILFEDSMDKKI